MSFEALEIEIENAWLALATLPEGEGRTLYLTETRRIIWVGKGKGRMLQARAEVGTYTRAATLASVREDVFFVGETMRRAA